MTGQTERLVANIVGAEWVIAVHPPHFVNNDDVCQLIID